jgi:hypothetical protein
MDDDIEDFQKSSILASKFKGELTRESYIIIVLVRKPERVGKAFEEELKELADILIDGNS